MAETWLPLALPPGVVRLGTAYSSKGRWYNSNLVRFQGPVVRPVGGWRIAQTAAGADIQVTGFPRDAWSWRKADSTAWLAVGTTGTPSKLYAYSNAVLTDITPAGLTNGAADGTLSTGAGAWGGGGWGQVPWGGTGAAGVVLDAATWSLDNFGEILVACLTSDGKLYSSTPTTQAAQITNSPTGCRAVCVTPERFVLALGASSDPRNVAWCSQGAITTWAAAVGNSAGSFPLQTGGRLLAGHRMDRETLLWTDADLWSATYVSAPYFYTFARRGDNCGLIGPNAVAIAGGVAYWMGAGQFFTYAGSVRTLECDVLDYVFGDLSLNQKAKITAVTVAQFGEVWWFIPSASQGGTENDRAVTYNYRTGAWTLHALARAAGVDAGVFTAPLLVATDGRLYSHETGQDRGGAAAFIESGPLELGDGERTALLSQMLPDEKLSGQLTATFYTTLEPETAEATSGPYMLTPRTNLRVSGRQVRIRLSEPTNTGIYADGTHLADGTSTAAGFASGTDFRIGTFRLGVIPQGRR